MMNSRPDSWVEGHAEKATTLELQKGSNTGLLKAYYATSCVVAAYLFYMSFDLDDPLVRVLGAAPVMIASLFPTYLWCAGRVRGVPIFPLFALTYLWTYAMPLVSRHPIIAAYDNMAILTAGLTVTGCLLLATLPWYAIATSPAPTFHEEKILLENRGRAFFLAVIATAAILTVLVTGQWLDLEPGVYSIVRAILIALATVGLFAISYQWGKREIPLAHQLLFVGIFILYLLAQLSSLFMVGAITAVGLVIVGYTTGRHHFPMVWVAVAVIMFGVFHLGKGAMREKYWGDNPQAVQIWDYPRFFAEWSTDSMEEINATGSVNESQPIYERVSLAHLLLKVQSETPETVPYLYGATYAIIPGLLVPRIINPDKLTAHEGTTILNVHYGIQEREETSTTTIGWGLLNEAYANFGMLGVAGLGLLLGGMYGWVTRMTAGAPVLALRSLVAMTFAALAIQAEFTAGVYLSALFQSLVAVLAAGFFLMNRRPAHSLQTKGL